MKYINNTKTKFKNTNLNGHVVQIEEKNDFKAALHFDKWASPSIHILHGAEYQKTGCVYFILYETYKYKHEERYQNTIKINKYRFPNIDN